MCISKSRLNTVMTRQSIRSRSDSEYFCLLFCCNLQRRLAVDEILSFTPPFNHPPFHYYPIYFILSSSSSSSVIFFLPVYFALNSIKYAGHIVCGRLMLLLCGWGGGRRSLDVSWKSWHNLDKKIKKNKKKTRRKFSVWQWRHSRLNTHTAELW